MRCNEGEHPPLHQSSVPHSLKCPFLAHLPARTIMSLARSFLVALWTQASKVISSNASASDGAVGG